MFVGPAPETLALFGDKAMARAHAQRNDVPILRGTAGGIDIGDAAAFLESLGPDGAITCSKAVAGGNGVAAACALCTARARAGKRAFERCRSEAQAAFGDGALYAEEFFPYARHVEVQIVGDGTGAVSHLWDRECSAQRQRQKIVEIAPARDLPDGLRHRLFDAAGALRPARRNTETWERSGISGRQRARRIASRSLRPIPVFRSSTPSRKKLPGSTSCASSWK